MAIVTNVYAYEIAFRLTHKKTSKTEEHVCKSLGYSMSEAITSALTALCAEHDIDIEQYQLKILSCGPDMQQIASALDELLKRGAR